MATPDTKPENILPMMIVLGIMFLGICIAMNLFSRARFKKRTNAFAVAGRSASGPQRRPTRSAPGRSQRLESTCPSPLPASASDPRKQSHSFASSNLTPNNGSTSVARPQSTRSNRTSLSGSN